MKNWLRVPAGAPIDPGSIEVKKVGISIVLIPVIKPKSSLEMI